MRGIHRHPTLSASLAASVLVVGGIEYKAYSDNWTTDVPAGSCFSPVAHSRTYRDPRVNMPSVWAGVGVSGVIASGELPEGARGVQASFKSPEAGDQAWQDNTSDLITPNTTGFFALKMAIGPGSVQFGVRVVAEQGSPLCNSAPEVTFYYANQASYASASGQLPWVNPVNGPVNILLAMNAPQKGGL